MTSADTRAATARAAADALQKAGATVASMRVVAGFDGMVDSIIRVVDRREGPVAFTPMRRIEQFAQRVAIAAGKSINIELGVEHVKIGGNGVLMADGLARAGAKVSFIGSVGMSDAPPGSPGSPGSREVRAVFREFAARCAAIYPTSPPGFTDACEFDDGKVMLGKTADLSLITWESVTRAVGGPAALTAMLDGAGLLIPVSWTQVPHMDEIWKGLCESLAKIPRERRPWIFIDLADPAKRTEEALKAALALLREMNSATPLALGLNLAESQRIARAVGAPEPKDLDDAAVSIRKALGLACVVTHSRVASAGATEKESARFAGPFVQRPKMSTGAGDHFNAGFSLGWRLGLPIAQALAVGASVSGWYVREAKGPSLAEVASFLRDLPAPEA